MVIFWEEDFLSVYFLAASWTSFLLFLFFPTSISLIFTFLYLGIHLSAGVFISRSRNRRDLLHVSFRKRDFNFPSCWSWCFRQFFFLLPFFFICYFLLSFYRHWQINEVSIDPLLTDLSKFILPHSLRDQTYMHTLTHTSAHTHI